MVEFFAALQQACRDAIEDVLFTVGRPLAVLSDLLKSPPRDETAVARLNAELKKVVYNN